MTDFLAIDIDTQTAAFVVALTVLIPEDSDITAMIGDIVKAEPVPFAFGDKGIDLNGIVVARAQTDETGYDEVVECRVIIVAATLLITLQPIACNLVEILAYIGTATMVLRLDVAFHLSEISAVGDDRILFGIQIVGKCGQSLGRGKWPDCTVPFAFTHTARAEFRVTALGSRKTIRS